MDIRRILAGANATDFAVTFGAALSDGMISEINRTTYFGKSRVRRENFGGLVVDVAEIRLLRVSVKFKDGVQPFSHCISFGESDIFACHGRPEHSFLGLGLPVYRNAAGENHDGRC